MTVSLWRWAAFFWHDASSKGIGAVLVAPDTAHHQACCRVVAAWCRGFQMGQEHPRSPGSWRRPGILLYGCALHAAGFSCPGYPMVRVAFCCGGIGLFFPRKVGLGPAVEAANARWARSLADWQFVTGSTSILPRRKADGVNPEPFLQLDRVITRKGAWASCPFWPPSPQLSFTEMRDALTMTDGNVTATCDLA